MDKQRYAKPYAARFFIYRWLVGGTWRKYGYSLAGNYLWGWYWTQKDLDYACGGQLSKLKEQVFKINSVKQKILSIWKR